MAEALLGVVAETVITKAFELAAEQLSGAWNLREDLQSLAEQLEMIQALLSDLESKSATSRSVELWLRKLEDAATDADYLLDEFAYHVLRKKIEEPKLQDKVRKFFSSNSLAFRFKMASKIKESKLRMTSILQESTQIGLVRGSDEIINSSIRIRRDRITDPFVDDSEIVGRKDDVEEVVRALTSSGNEKGLSVIGIVGMAGQGKTTLAQLAYKEEEVTRYFKQKMWVCVSDDFSVERILNDMFQSLTGTVSALNLRVAIVNKLKEKLNGKRFLLALDDVWNEDAERWSCMKKCLQEIGGSGGSKILVTTRNETVVSVMRASFIHQLLGLSEEESWNLFEKMAFADGGAMKKPELVDIGKKMVKRCLGLPLAVKALGGLMYSRKDAKEWSKIGQSNNLLGSSDATDRVRSVMKLSYDHLPSQSLKQCFAYCAVFRKDSIIKRKPLIQQWMAHGLLNPSRGSELDMEDVGTNYFNILRQRSLFQEAKLDELGNIESCKMHDLVHDFALEASKDRCLIVEGGMQSEDIKAVHLSVISHRSKSLNISTKNLSRLRTLILFGLGSISFDVLTNCERLRVLVIDDKSVEELPDFIVKLKHLRYLDIFGTSIKKLPNSITRLYNLQTLIFSPLDELPRDFRNLVKLRNFYVYEEFSIPYVYEKDFLIPGIRNITSLRTLPHFVVSPDERCQIEELQHLRSLEGHLTIFGLENVKNHEEASKADLSSKRNIVSLKFCWSSTAPNEQECNHKDVLEGLKPHPYVKGLKIFNFAGESLPSWMVSISPQSVLGNLVSITLKNHRRCQQIPQLGHLPNLEFDKFEDMESVKCIGDEFYGWTNQGAPAASSPVAFPKLKKFELGGMPDLEHWSDPHEWLLVFPHLEKLDVWGAPKLSRLPDLLNKISSLRNFSIRNLGLSHLPKGLGGLSSLEVLEIEDCESLLSIPSMQGLRSLRVFGIVNCNKLGGLLEGLEECVKLEYLRIDSCSSLSFKDLCFPANLRKLRLFPSEDVDYEVFPWPSKCTALPALEVLYLRGTSKMQSLPDQLCLPKLRFTVILSLGEMEALPDWLCYGQTLTVRRCPKLAYLPSKAALQRLGHSSDFFFYDCPILEERYEKGSRPEYYDKIADLTNDISLLFPSDDRIDIALAAMLAAQFFI